MIKIKQIINSFVFSAFLVFVFYIAINNEALSIKHDLPLSFIPAFCLISILYLGYRYTILQLETSKLEHEFTSIMNHAFRTPLTKAIWFTKELEKDMPVKDKLTYLQNITNATSRVLDIIDLLAGIKNINDRSSYVFEAVSIREIVEKSMAKYSHDIESKNITFQISSFADIPLLSVDLKKISFVVDTLIENAVLYTETGGKITVECISKTNKLTLFVSDTGLGLSFRDKMRIFSRFYRSSRAQNANTDGMGVRLYLSKQIIGRHNGKIYAKSKGKNKGTTFFVELPFHN